MHSPAILVHGADPGLLRTRAWVLERAGYRVVLSMNFADAEQIIALHSPNLMVLCHTVEPEDCERILTMAHHLRPSMRTLVLAAGKPICAAALEEQILSALDGPEALLAVVQNVLRPSDPSRAIGQQL